MDRRKKLKCVMSWAVVFAFIAWVALVDALSATPPMVASVSEHADDIVNLQWRVIAGLTGLVQVLVGFIYISGINSVKQSIRTLFHELKEIRDAKLDKEDHDRLCKTKEKK